MPGGPTFDPPEILTSDLAPLALTLAQWGAGDPAGMAWIDPPPVPAMAAAQAQLRALGALDADKPESPRTAAPWRSCQWSQRWPICSSLPPGAARRGRRRGLALAVAGARPWRKGRGSGATARSLERRTRRPGGGIAQTGGALGGDGGARLFVHRLRTCRWTRASSAPGRASRGSLPRSHRPPPVRQRRGMAVLRGPRLSARSRIAARHRRMAGDRRCARAKPKARGSWPRWRWTKRTLPAGCRTGWKRATP